MSILSVSLPDDVREWIEQEAAARGASLDEFLSDIARQARVRVQEERAAKEAELEASLLEALDAGEPQPVDEQWWKTVHAAVEARLSDGAVANGTQP